jgi:hypothetical protein
MIKSKTQGAKNKVFKPHEAIRYLILNLNDFLCRFNFANNNCWLIFCDFSMICLVPEKIYLWFLLFLDLGIEPALPRTIRILPFLCGSWARFLQPARMQYEGKKGENPPRPMHTPSSNYFSIGVAQHVKDLIEIRINNRVKIWTQNL